MAKPRVTVIEVATRAQRDAYVRPLLAHLAAEVAAARHLSNAPARVAALMELAAPARALADGVPLDMARAEITRGMAARELTAPRRACVAAPPESPSAIVAHALADGDPDDVTAIRAAFRAVLDTVLGVPDEDAGGVLVYPFVTKARCRR